MVKKLAVFMPSWVGDAVMATPALRALSQHLEPGGEMLGVMQPVIGQVLGGAPWFTEELHFSKRRWRDRIQVIPKLRAWRPDAIVLFTNSLWTATTARLAGIPKRVGYARDGRTWLLTDTLPVVQRGGQAVPVPAVDYYLALAGLLGCDVSDRRMELSVENSDQRMADQLFERIGFRADKPLVVINSSGAWGSAKLWPADHVEQLAKRIVENHHWQVLLHCGPAEREAADAVATRLNHPRVQSMGRADQLPVGLSKSVLARAAVVVSTDSGPRHIAVALGRQVITLYGPTDSDWTKTYNTPEIDLSIKMACRACWQKRCPLGHMRCLRDLGVESVYAAVIASQIESQSRAA